MYILAMAVQHVKKTLNAKPLASRASFIAGAGSNRPIMLLVKTPQPKKASKIAHPLYRPLLK